MELEKLNVKTKFLHVVLKEKISWLALDMFCALIYVTYLCIDLDHEDLYMNLLLNI